VEFTFGEATNMIKYSDEPEEKKDPKELRKRMGYMLIGVAILFGCIIIYKVFMGIMFRHFMASEKHVVAVSTMKVGLSAWEPKLKAVGSLRAIRGVNVTTQLAGMVQDIYFDPGTMVQKNFVLAKLNIDPETAQLHALQATQSIDQITFDRDSKQFKVKGISKEQLDTDAANLANIKAQVAQQQATIAQKIIQAPFSGRLGIRLINPGQYLNPGDTVVTLQQLDPIYDDFYVPQQSLEQLQVGQHVDVTSDSYPGQTFTATITTLNPLVDSTTRNVEIEATVSNPKLLLVPGMFSYVNVETGAAVKHITVPQTVIVYNAYGDYVYLVESKKDKDDKDTLTVTQVFVTTGETRGDQVSILKGIKEGDTVVTSGQLKLKNGDQISVNNSIAPPNNPSPRLSNEHEVKG
jgi:membrane fusion protein (multidrug efflux system)